MPIRTGDKGPYGPPQAILDLIEGYRDRGLATPFTPEVLLRAGINESLVNRTLRSLESLDLIDADGRPTEELEGLRRAPSTEFKARLEAVIRAAYAEVFQFVDPATDDTTKIADAFRAYEPVGQRARMVTLFVGLCKAAGIMPESASGGGGSGTNSGRTSRPKAATTRKAARNAPPDNRKAAPNVAPSALPAPIAGLLAALPSPEKGWTAAERKRFLSTFESVLDFSITIREEGPQEEGDDD